MTSVSLFNRLFRSFSPVFLVAILITSFTSGCTIRRLTPKEQEETPVVTWPAPENRGPDYVNRKQHKTVALNPITLTANSTPDEIDNWARYENIPQWVRQVYFGNHFDYRYTIDFSSVRPLYLMGDFNNDGKQDVALILGDMFRVAKMRKLHPDSQEPPDPIMAIFHYGSNEVFLVTKDLPQIQLFQVTSRHENLAGSGDGILVGEPQGEEKFIYWDGHAYQSEWVERPEKTEPEKSEKDDNKN